MGLLQTSESDQESLESRLNLKSRLPLESQRLLLRQFKTSDDEGIFRIHRDHLVTRFAGGTKTKEESLRSLLNIIDRTKAAGFGPLAVICRETDELIGWCGVQRMKDASEYEIVFALRSERWGAGLATEAARALLTATFEVAQGAILHIAALVFPQNLRSIAVLAKLGMTFQGHYFDRITQRHACLYRATEKQFRAALVRSQLQSSSK